MAAPTTIASVQQMLSALVKSRLLAPDDAKALFGKFTDESGDNVDDPETFRKYLVSKRILTDYQAALIARGHSEGFFLGPYKILDRIGKGRMAGVYKAVHNIGEVVAVKVLPASKAKDPKTLSRFQREAKLAQQLNHPNIVRSLDVGDVGGVHYIVMELLNGETLDEVLERRKRLPAAEAVRLIIQTLTGLQEVFERKMVHRDLKPANLMLVPAPSDRPNDTTLDSTVKILDIGLGRTTFDENSQDDEPETQLTSEGVLLGTPDYLAPEQARDAHAADIRSDLYSVGCILYHLLTGQPPFPDTNVLSQILRHATEKAKPLADFGIAVHPNLALIVERLMEKDPNKRFQTPAETITALQSFEKSAASASGTTARSGVQPAVAFPMPSVPVQPIVVPTPPQAAWPTPAAVPPAAADDLSLDGEPVPPQSPAPQAGTSRSGPVPAAPRPSGTKPAPSARQSGVISKVQPAPTPAAPEPPADIPVGRLVSGTSGKNRKPDVQQSPSRSGRLVVGQGEEQRRPAAFPPTPPTSPEDFDVELVAVSLPDIELPAGLRERSYFDPDKRDWIMLSAGAGAVLIAIIFGWILSLAFGSSKKKIDESEATPPASNPAPAKQQSKSTSTVKPEKEDKPEKDDPSQSTGTPKPGSSTNPPPKKEPIPPKAKDDNAMPKDDTQQKDPDEMKAEPKATTPIPKKPLDPKPKDDAMKKDDTMKKDEMMKDEMKKE